MIEPRAALAAVSAVAAGFAVGALAVVDALAWRRTSDLRHGVDPVRTPSGAGGPTGGWTRMAGWAGVGIIGLGVARASVAWAIAGAVVTVEGFRSRVVSVTAGAEGFGIRYRWRRPVTIGWDDLRGVVPPRTPAAGWAFLAGGRGPGRRRLMPSDLFGVEETIVTAIARAGLRFVDGAWRRGP